MNLFIKRHKREQADLVSAWIAKEEDVYAWIAVSNQSNLPVYKVILSTVNIQGKAASGIESPNDHRALLSVAPPGKWYTKLLIQRGMSFIPGVELAFMDNKGQYWVRTGDGILRAIHQPSYEYYNLTMPVSWEYPKDSIG